MICGFPRVSRARLVWLAFVLPHALLVGAPSTADETARPHAVLSDLLSDSDSDGQLPPDLGARHSGQDWPLFLGPQQNGCSLETGIRTSWPAPGPPIVWQVKLGAGYSGPTVSRGRLFHFDRHEEMARLTCRAAETGEELWRVQHPTDFEDMLGYNNGPRCTPVVDGPRVYSLGAEGILQCVRVIDGELLWRVDTSKRFGVVNNFFGVGSTPTVAGDLLIANIGGSPPESPANIYAARGRVQGNNSGVVAFDKLTGKVAWQATDELASYASPVTATIDGQAWCFVFARDGLLGLNPVDGATRFRFPWRSMKLESVNAATPVVHENQVFISETYGPEVALLKVRPDGHDVLWKDDPRKRDKALQLHWNTPILHAGYLYGSSGRHAGEAELRCVAWATGQVQWSQPGMLRCSLTLVDGHLICLSEGGTLYLLQASPQRYAEVASVRLRDAQGQPLLKPNAWAAPVVAQGLLYVRGEDRLVCLELLPESLAEDSQ